MLGRESAGVVPARLVERAEDWPFSSVHAHLAGRDDRLTTVAPALDLVGDFRQFLETPRDDTTFETLRRAESIGRPVGSTAFLERLETQLKRPLKPQKRGPRTAAYRPE